MNFTKREMETIRMALRLALDGELHSFESYSRRYLPEGVYKQPLRGYAKEWHAAQGRIRRLKDLINRTNGG